MKTDRFTYEGVPTPCYIIEEDLLRRNLELIRDVSRRAGVEIILAFKAFALWKSFPVFREYISHTTASSLYEARLAAEEFGSKAHTYSPAYTERDFDQILSCSSHVTFNSMSQYARFYPRVEEYNRRHCHCESGADVFERTLAHIEEKFSPWFPQLKWINFGGGHLMTRKDYDVEHLINIIKGFHQRYPHLKIIMEPGSAFGWQTGPLVTQVVDVVEDKGIRTAIINASFTCHMPDCLEMPYMPAVRNAETLEVDDPTKAPEGAHIYRIGGNSCLSGDFMGFWKFDHELQIGENVIFEDMLHYTTVKTNTFNGITHPSIGIVHLDGKLETLRDFSYEDYRSRMD